MSVLITLIFIVVVGPFILVAGCLFLTGTQKTLQKFDWWIEDRINSIRQSFAPPTKEEIEALKSERENRRIRLEYRYPQGPDSWNT